MFKETFTKALANYSIDASLSNTLWNEIDRAYKDEHRHFHNLNHLEHLLSELSCIKDQLSSWEAIVFAIAYHDYAYDVVQYVLDNDNEERSAAIASEKLKSAGVNDNIIADVHNHILATKKHQQSSNSDNNFFIDADLSILGQPWDVYAEYSKNIRKEYEVYPDSIYHAGRMKVLKNFIERERLYITPHFHELYEKAAKDNLRQELELLSLL